MSVTEKDIFRNIIKDLLDNNIIHVSVSPYASPVLLVKKRSRDQKLAIDYRRLNAKLVKEKYPLPLIDDQLDRLGGHYYFITLDMASGFYQVPMKEEFIEKIALITPEGHFEFLRIPFGIANSPAVFQRLVNNLLGELRNTIAFPYIDDIIIPAKTIKRGYIHSNRYYKSFKK